MTIMYFASFHNLNHLKISDWEGAKCITIHYLLKITNAHLYQLNKRIKPLSPVVSYMFQFFLFLRYRASLFLCLGSFHKRQ